MRKLKWLAVFLIAGMLFSCSEHETFSDINNPVVEDEFTVSKAAAEDIASNLLLEDPNSKSFDGAKKQMKSILEVPSDNGRTAFFIITYEGGGFVILAADKRSEPVLAFSETNEFDLDPDNVPSGLVSWLFSSKETIESIREKKEEVSPRIEKQWTRLEKDRANLRSYRTVESGAKATSCQIQVAPLLQTTWGQGCGYNTNTPSMSCNYSCTNTSANTNAPTGCVATAMAQVMKYHQYPTNYSWSSMNNNYGTTETARLMRNIGIAVDMDYDCDGSGTDTKDEAPSSFKDDFGYSSASYAGFKAQTVKNELDNDRPVILKGGRKAGWWIFSYYKGGHAWVCDGYRECSGTLELHMNWGWNGGYNGFFRVNDFNPGSSSFNYKKGMVYNIRP